MIGYDEIAKVCFENDQESDAGLGFETIVKKSGVDPIGLMGVAEQRALRGWWLSQGNKLPIPGRVQLPTDDPVFVWSATSWLDGFLTGLRLVEDLPQSSHRRSGR